jgi:hypothetical protein
LADWCQPMARVDNKLLGRYPSTLTDPDPMQNSRI